MEEPFIVAIKRHSLEDGPGIRSVLFFKGCPLRCGFCQNPETQVANREIAFYEARCQACGACASACPRPIIADGTSPDPCRGCSLCADACPHAALVAMGRRYTVDDLVELLLRDEPFYRRSGGGVTFSGGECTLFPHYLEAVARVLKERGIHLCIETCGEFPSAVFVERLLPLIDLVYFDLKLADPEAHRLHTGRDNRRILENLATLARFAPERVRVRIPVIPEVTLSDENFAALIERIRACGLSGAILLPYNPLGLHMVRRLRRDHPLAMKAASSAAAPAPASSSAEPSPQFMTAAEFAAATARFEAIARRLV